MTTSTTTDRRMQLLAAADRVVQREGSAATMNVIAAEAGITKPILYRHFGDKGGLYRALAERHTDLLLERLRAALTTRGGLQARTLATVDAYLASVEEQPQVYRFLMERAAVEEPGVRGRSDDLGGELVEPLLQLFLVIGQLEGERKVGHRRHGVTRGNICQVTARLRP